VLQDGESVVLIDTGRGLPSGDRESFLLRRLARIGITPEKVGLVLLTHMHGDHVGGVAWNNEKAFPNARILAHRHEYDFWTSEESREKFPAWQGNFDLVSQRLEVSGGQIDFFDHGAKPAPGLMALSARGHTPGHTVFLLESQGHRLLFWGDLVHAAALQFPSPNENPVYDILPDESRATRLRIMEEAARDRLPVAGMHLPFPGVGRLEKAGEGYRFVPGL
jgi:glyoxylase-like metal-dependent hydrolase (beta-lactamase superfamily II)